MIELRTPRLVARVDPDRGGAIAGISAFGEDDWLWSTDGVDLARIAQAPDEDPGTLSMRDWQLHSRGGWEVMAPNAGDRGVVAGREYPFHGTAGRATWQVGSQRDAAIELTFADDTLGFRSRRVIEVRDATCTVTESIASTSDEPIPVAWGSHLAFGRTLISGGIDLWLPGEIVSTDLPELRFPQQGTSGFAVVRHLGTNVALVRNRDTGASASVTVRGSAFPYLWVWVELGGTTGWPWFGSAHALGIEPVSAPHARGVADLPGVDHVLHPGETHSATVGIRLEKEGGATA
jgi:galactose mutarotase-like enzyme